MTDTATLFGSETRYQATSLSIQAGVDQVPLAAKLHLTYGWDVVLTASTDPRHNPYSNLEGAARRFYELTGTMPELDANRYAGPSRKHGAIDPNVDWLRRQVELGVDRVITDQGFIDGDPGEIREALRRAVDAQNAVDAPLSATVSFPSQMFKQNAPEIRDIIAGCPLEVGLALGHAGDPVATNYAVRALMDLIPLGNVRSRRIDLSGVGVLALGSPGASIGTKATLRHVYAISDSHPPVSPFPSILVEKAMCWRTQDRVMDAALVFLDHVFWLCECDHCEGRPLWAAVQTEADAIAHNFAVIARIAHKVLTSPDPMVTWFEMCQHAQTYAFEIAAESGPSWEPQNFLGAWVSNRPSLVGV